MKDHSLKWIKRYHNISLGNNISTIQYWFCIGNYMGYKLMWYYDPFSPKDCQHGIKLDFKAHFAQYTKLEDLQLLTVAVGVQPKKETLLTTALWWQKSKTTLEFKTWFLVALKCFIGINKKKKVKIKQWVLFRTIRGISLVLCNRPIGRVCNQKDRGESLSSQSAQRRFPETKTCFVLIETEKWNNVWHKP